MDSHFCDLLSDAQDKALAAVQAIVRLRDHAHAQASNPEHNEGQRAFARAASRHFAGLEDHARAVLLGASL